MTAVEKIIEYCEKQKRMDLNSHRGVYYNIIRFCEEQAKKMEKEKHLNWNKFLEGEKTLGISDVKTIERVQWYYNEYYNETFKQQEQ